MCNQSYTFAGIKHSNLYMMRSAWKPKYLLDDLIHFMNTPGRDEDMWASNHSVLDMTESIQGVDEITDKLRPDVLEGYLYDNAKPAVLAKRNPPRLNQE